MAITINQQPTSPNLSNNDLVFALNSGYVAQPQFQYVCDIKDKDNTLVQRIKQQPNPTGYGVFDIGQIITANVGTTDNVWKTQVAQVNTTCGKDFKVFFGEEYGTSPSSSVLVYNGITNASPNPPAKTGSAFYFDLDGTLDPNDKVNWNWASSSKLDEHIINDDTFNYQFGLTDFPATQSVRTSDYQTISILNGNTTGAFPTGSATIAQDIWTMTVTEYDATGSLLATTEYYNSSNDGNGGPRVNFSQIWDDVDTNQNQGTRLIHFPAGPQNFADAGNTLNANTAYYVCTFYEQATDGFKNDNGKWGTYRFDIVGRDCGYTGVRFAWKNKYGVWDYYTFPLAESTISNIERSSFKQTFVNFSTTSTTVSYDKARRGKTQFLNKINKARTAESDWLTQTYADLLLELFYSTNVYIQDGTDLLPITVTNGTITEKTNPRTQKTFKYTLEYTLANDTQNRL